MVITEVIFQVELMVSYQKSIYIFLAEFIFFTFDFISSVDVSRHEIGRFIKLTDNYIESIRIICPRKSEEFQEDLFPDARSEEPAL